MEMAPPASTSYYLFSAPPPGYQTLGTATTTEKDGSKVCLRAGSATVEVMALAPDLFRVGLFPHGRSACYSSEAVVSREWEPGRVSIREETGQVTATAGLVTISTSVVTAHLSLDPLRIGFTDHTGRAFATDDPEFGMGWFTLPEQVPSLDIINPPAT